MMRKLLMTTAILCFASGAALAADLPYRKSAPVYTPPPPAFTWAGLYVGGQIGYQWGSASPNLYGPDGSFVTTLPTTNASGIVGGAHLGYNFQVSQLVFGLEGDINGLSYQGTNYAAGFLSPFTTRENVEGSVRGRIGYAFDRILVYGTGGVAFGNFQNTYTGIGGGFDSLSSTRTGWTVGGGVEYAVTNNWSIRAEYRYTDFGRNNDFLNASLPGDYVHQHIFDNRVQVGFSYKFDMFAPPGPVVAKY